MKNKIVWTAVAASATALFVFLRRKARKATMKMQLPVKAPERHLTKAYARNRSFVEGSSHK